jgi:hypothetical protein
MRNAYFGLFLTVFLLSAVGGLRAQTETVINARDSPHVQRADEQGGGWCAGVNPDTNLEAQFTIDNTDPKPGSAMNYELLVTNKGEKAIALPRALDWKEVDSGSLEQRYLVARVTLELRAEGGAHTYIAPLALYSTAEKPGTALVLRPGDSLRLLGSAILPATALQGAGRANLLGHLCVSDMTKTFEQSRIGLRVRGDLGQMLWCANAAEKYEVNYEAQR